MGLVAEIAMWAFRAKAAPSPDLQELVQLAHNENALEQLSPQSSTVGVSGLVDLIKAFTFSSSKPHSKRRQDNSKTDGDDDDKEVDDLC